MKTQKTELRLSDRRKRKFRISFCRRKRKKKELKRKLKKPVKKR